MTAQSGLLNLHCTTVIQSTSTETESSELFWSASMKIALNWRCWMVTSCVFGQMVTALGVWKKILGSYRLSQFVLYCDFFCCRELSTRIKVRQTIICIPTMCLGRCENCERPSFVGCKRGRLRNTKESWTKPTITTLSYAGLMV